jgi:hypothetical protein
VVDVTDGAAVRTTVTGANGAYTFSGLTAGAYVVREVIPSGYIRIGPGSHAVSISSGSVVRGKDFYNYQLRDCRLTNVTYDVNRNGVRRTYNTLAGNVRAGDVVTVRFTVPTGETDMVSFVSYRAPSGNFAQSQLSRQTVFDRRTGTFGPGRHMLTVTIPRTYFQIDLVCGCVIPRFGAVGSNIFYTPQQRLIAAANGGPSTLVRSMPRDV